MRFLGTTADIPDALINDVLAGRAVFLCGAGISMRLDMGSFRVLTQRIYEYLGESPANEPAEKIAFDKEEYDRALRALEKRLYRQGDLTSRVRQACAAVLKVPEPLVAEDHNAILKLSRDEAGNVRVLTTNFDTIFERVAADPSIPSFAGKALPKPGSVRDFGIHHLHGRLADGELPETDLVLTSADFGDAYLRDGWASQYIEDRSRTATLVLLGYSADDAALRLLLETLDVDRARFPDLRPIYALDRAKPDSADLWRAKGIIPIEFADHDGLYQTIAEWSKYAERPSDYERDKLAEVFVVEPKDATAFQQEQMAFFLARGDTAELLTVHNPPLSWLSVLSKLNLVSRDDRRLTGWIERKLPDLQAIRDIVENIHMFGPATADLLEFRLNHQVTALPELQRKSWQLIVRHLRSARMGPALSGWYDIQPRLLAGETDVDLLNRLTELVRPAVKIEKHSPFDTRERPAPVRPVDLFSVSFEPDQEIQVPELLAGWPATASADDDDRLLQRLVAVLDSTLEDAIEVGVELTNGFSTTDVSVPSIADHPQNNYHHGFLAITRLTAEVWTRLAVKDPVRAARYVNRWQLSPHRLNHRLALFAATSLATPADRAMAVLLAVPAAELFVTGTAVEANRLIFARWSEFGADDRAIIEERIRTGPPQDWYREGADYARALDRARYNIIGAMIDANCVISEATRALFNDIQQREPQWQPKPREQAGFGIWQGSLTTDDNPVDAVLTDVADDVLVAEATRLDSEAPFGDGRHWNTISRQQPDRALRALELEAANGVRRVGAWQQLLWSPSPFEETDAAQRILAQLLDWPAGSFAEIAGPAATWLESTAGLGLGDHIWPLWDRLLQELPPMEQEEIEPLDAMDRALNKPIGRLTEILLKKMPPSEGEQFENAIKPRLAALLNLEATASFIARVRFAADVSYLFSRAPVWTAEHVVPLFQWDSADAMAAWAARRYSGNIGRSELFKLTKSAFLKLFERPDLPSEMAGVYGDWLVAIMIANRREPGLYDLSPAEARNALRKTGNRALQTVAHHLAQVMESAKPDEKIARWRETVGPVFSALWPLDAELQTSATTQKLAQILNATGYAFAEAADIILPFVRAEDARNGSTVFSLSRADQVLFDTAPAKVLDLVAAVIGNPPNGAIYSLRKLLDRIIAADPTLGDSRKFQNLSRLA